MEVWCVEGCGGEGGLWKGVGVVRGRLWVVGGGVWDGVGVGREAARTWPPHPRQPLTCTQYFTG